MTMTIKAVKAVSKCAMLYTSNKSVQVGRSTVDMQYKQVAETQIMCYFSFSFLFFSPHYKSTE